jgi:hypothetical protein
VVVGRRALYGPAVGAPCGYLDRLVFSRMYIGTPMNLHLSLTPLISLLAGILILLMPRLLNFIVAIYLIAIGLIGIFGAGAFRLN